MRTHQGAQEDCGPSWMSSRRLLYPKAICRTYRDANYHDKRFVSRSTGHLDHRLSVRIATTAGYHAPGWEQSTFRFGLTSSWENTANSRGLLNSKPKTLAPLIAAECAWRTPWRIVQLFLNTSPLADATCVTLKTAIRCVGLGFQMPQAQDWFLLW